MKIIFALVVIIILGGLFLSFKNSLMQNTSKNTSTTAVPASPSPIQVVLKTYIAPKNSFSVQYPANWAVREYDEGVGFYPNDPGFSSEGAPPIMFRYMPKLPSDAALSFEQYAKVAATHEIQNYQSLATIRPVTTAGGLTGYQTTWKVLPLGANAKLTESLPITYFEQLGNKNMVIQIALENANFSDVYQQIINSMR